MGSLVNILIPLISLYINYGIYGMLWKCEPFYTQLCWTLPKENILINKKWRTVFCEFCYDSFECLETELGERREGLEVTWPWLLEKIVGYANSHLFWDPILQYFTISLGSYFFKRFGRKIGRQQEKSSDKVNIQEMFFPHKTFFCFKSTKIKCIYRAVS